MRIIFGILLPKVLYLDGWYVQIKMTLILEIIVGVTDRIIDYTLT